MAVLGGLWLGGVLAAGLAVVAELLFERGLRAAVRDKAAIGRPWFFRLGVLVFVAALNWPVAWLGHTLVFVEAIQLGLLGFAVPALVAVGGPWAAFGERAGKLPARARVAQARSNTLTKAGAAATAPRLHRGIGGPAGTKRSSSPVDGKGRLWARALVFVAAVIIWRLPALVDAIHAVPLLSLVEAATLIPLGLLLWRQLIGSGTHSPKADRALRIGLAAVVMWGIWIAAYALGFFENTVFPAYAHEAGRILGPVADQELSAGVMFVGAAASFVPVVFWNLFRWLRSQDDIDEALYEALRNEAHLHSEANPLGGALDPNKGKGTSNT